MNRYSLIFIIIIFSLIFLSCKDEVLNTTTAPTVSIVSPAKNAIVGEHSNIKVEAFDDGQIVRMEVYVNHTLFFVGDSQKSFYQFTLDTQYYSDGTQILLEAIAYDNDGNKTESKVVIVYVYHFKPANLTARIKNRFYIELNWFDVSTKEEGFLIEEKIDSSEFRNIGRVDSNITTFTVNQTVDSSKSYYFRVRAFASGVLSDYTPIVKAQVDLQPPLDVHGHFISDTALSLGWDDRNDFESGYWIYINSYRVFQTVANQTSVTIPYNFYNNEIYEIKIAPFSDYSVGRLSAPLYLTFILSAPNGLQLDVVQKDKISLSWANTSIYNPKFSIERRTDSGDFSQIAAPISELNYIDTDIDTSQTYFYRVRAVTDNNFSDYSNTVEIKYERGLKLAETVTVPFDLTDGSFSGDYKYYFKRNNRTVDMYQVRDFSYMKTFETPTDVETPASEEILSNLDGSLVVRHYGEQNANNGNRIALWSTESGSLVNYFYEDFIGKPFAFTNDNTKLISFDDPNFHVYSLATGELLKNISRKNYVLFGYKANPTSNEMYIYYTTVIDIYNLNDQSRKDDFMNREFPNDIFVPSEDGSIIFIAGRWARSFIIWDTSTKRVIYELNNIFTTAFLQVAISGDNKDLFISTNNGKILIYDIKAKKRVTVISVQDNVNNFSEIESPFNFISVSNNGRKYWNYDKAWYELK